MNKYEYLAEHGSIEELGQAFHALLDDFNQTEIELTRLRKIEAAAKKFIASSSTQFNYATGAWTVYLFDGTASYRELEKALEE